MGAGAACTSDYDPAQAAAAGMHISETFIRRPIATSLNKVVRRLLAFDLDDVGFKAGIFAHFKRTHQSFLPGRIVVKTEIYFVAVSFD